MENQIGLVKTGYEDAYLIQFNRIPAIKDGELIIIVKESEEYYHFRNIKKSYGGNISKDFVEIIDVDSY